MKLFENDMCKAVSSENYNYMFNKKSGLFHRWGAEPKDDPDYSPFGCEIADIEIGTSCSQGCKFCYKSNTPVGKNMSYETFVKIFNKLPKTLTQIAFGIGDIDGNPDLWKIMRHCREHGIIPNITINGFRMNQNPEYDGRLAEICGAVAVSLYDYDICYNEVQALGKLGMKQVNIHCLLSEETFGKCMQVAEDSLRNSRLKKNLNAIVYLWLKPKGRGKVLHQVSKQNYERLLKYLTKNNIRFGFDSCSAPHAMKYLPDFKECIEPCESTLFSVYINVDGKAFPCSFSEGGEFEGIDMLEVESFDDVWFSGEFQRFRHKLIENKDANGCRMCPVYNLELK